MQMASLLPVFFSPSSRPCLRLPSMASNPFNVVVEGTSIDSQAPKTLGILLGVIGGAQKKTPAPHGHPGIGWSSR
ncbi:hypothetical protein TNCV_4319491 [Trichonephila clavipes]|nr:hypothetical protein TNCV_4319491 [Trichonephila clavipes]